MANNITLGELITLALYACDMDQAYDSGADTGFIKHTEIVHWVNAALAKLHSILVACYEDYFVSAKTYTLQADQEEYALPDDFLKSLRVYTLYNSKYYRLKKYSVREKMRFRNNVVSTAVMLRYRIEGNNIVFVGPPDGGEVITIDYVPQYNRLTNTSEEVSLNIIVGWEDYVVNYVAAKCLAKEESDNSFFLGEVGRLEQEIREDAEARDLGEVNRARDFNDNELYDYWEEDLWADRRYGYISY